MNFGLTKDQYKFIYEKLVLPLREMGLEIYVFGSRARGDHQKFSDLDVLAKGDASGLDAKISEILETLEESTFPFKVDLVKDKDLATSYRENVRKDQIIF